MLEDVTKAMEKIDDVHSITIEKTFVGYQTSMLQLCRSMAKNSQDLVIIPCDACHVIVVTIDTEGYIISRGNGRYL